MTKAEILDIVKKRIEGQGTQIDASSVLPVILGGILDIADGASTKIGDLASLDTDHKSTLVDAINEIADIVETNELVVSLTQSVEERKAVYDLVKANPQLGKNVVVIGSDGLIYPVNGYGIIEDILHLHTIMDVEGTLTDMVLKIASNGSISA